VRNKFFPVILLLQAALLPAARAENYSLKDCLSYAGANNHEVLELSYGPLTYLAGQQEAEAVRQPKITVLTYVAPSYRITGGALTYDKDYSAWGPYWHTKIELQMPLYTWGKIDSYIRAAKKGAAVAESETLRKKREVEYEVKKYYYSLLLARTLKKVVEDADEILDEAITGADKLYKEGNGEIKKSDLEMLKVYKAEAEKNFHEADKGAGMARLALMQKMGMKEDENFDISDKKLLRDPYELRPAEFYVGKAFKTRPEWNMVRDGLQARQFLVDAEKADGYPVIFLAGEMNYDSAPHISDQKNPWLNDRFNDFGGGVAIGAKFDFSPKTLKAKIRAKEADLFKLREKEKFARDGIILQVKNAWHNAKEASENIVSARKGLDAAEKWVMAAGLVYGLGTGEVEDALKGLAARALARKNYYQAIFDYNMALADLAKSCGLSELSDE